MCASESLYAQNALLSAMELDASILIVLLVGVVALMAAIVGALVWIWRKASPLVKAGTELKNQFTDAKGQTRLPEMDEVIPFAAIQIIPGIKDEVIDLINRTLRNIGRAGGEAPIKHILMGPDGDIPSAFAPVEAPK